MQAKSNLISNIRLTILLSCIILCYTADILPKQMQIISSPIITDTGLTQNISICFADCDSCQSLTGSCEKCFAPWFQLSGGVCQLAFSQYTLESTIQEQRFINFIPSSQWSFNGAPVVTKLCSPNSANFTSNLTIIGLFGSGNVTYQRTISQHNYFTIKFLLILTNWTTTDSSLRIRITNQAGILISERSLTLNSKQIKNAYNQQLCSTTPLDKRISITLQVREQQSSQISIQFIGNMQSGATWGLSSFVLVTGPCSPSCAACLGYTPQPQSCDICSNFLANNENGQKCSTCLNGFNLSSTQNRCYKCPIQYKQCRVNDPTNYKCQYENITNINNNCNFTNQIYFDNKQVNQQTFFASLYSIRNKGANVYRCGAYSIVGPANFGDVITRTFLELPPHVQLSINLNLFIFDQDQATQRYTIAIIVDGQPFPIQPAQQTINITGSSNQCNLNPQTIKFDVIKTFETQTFIKHKKSTNVEIAVSLGTSGANSNTKWGLRDVRLVYKRCDDGCANCTNDGCQQCKGLFQLTDLECKGCLVGTGLNAGGFACQPCPTNCIQCSVKFNATNLTCTKCVSGFYLYKFQESTTCQINPAYGEPLGTSVSGSNNCSVDIPGTPSRNLNFQIVQNKTIRAVSFTNVSSIRKNIQFYLMKIDDWEGDYLDIYVNDLLVKRLQYGGLGKNFCGNEQGDQVSFQQFDLQDDNSTVTLQFEAVQKDTGKTRRFGVGNLRIFPVGCKDCQNYDFLYRVKYNYDDSIFAELAFNLVYVNNNSQQFKNIFRLKAGQRYLNYEITSNDSIRYWLKSQRINQGQIINQNLTVQCLYPERVTAQIPLASTQNVNSINSKQFFDRRVLQTAYNPNFQSTKILDNIAASVPVDRFSPLRGREGSVLGLQTFFNVITRIVIYLGFFSFFLGLQTSCTHVMHNFQKLWVHIYVATLALSPILKTALWGFREAQDQNIAINPNQWQVGLPKYLYYDAPAVYQHYYKDITFFRHIYNVGIAFAILSILYLAFYLVFRNKRQQKSKSGFLRYLKVTFGLRPIFNFNSVIFYQYFTVVIACCLQFLDLKTRTNQPTFAGLNAAACIIAFIFATLYPAIFHFILNRKRKSINQLIYTIQTDKNNKDYKNYDSNFELLRKEIVCYNNKYEQIFMRYVPVQLWNQNLGEVQLLGHSHILYNLFRYGDLWWHAIVVILLHYSPFAQAFLLIITNGFHLALVFFIHSNADKRFKIMKATQLLFFIVIQIMIIVMVSLLQTLRFESFETLGIVAIVFVFFIIVVTFIRFLYMLYIIYRRHNLPFEKDQNGVVRTQKGFTRNWDTFLQ